MALVRRGGWKSLECNSFSYCLLKQLKQFYSKHTDSLTVGSDALRHASLDRYLIMRSLSRRFFVSGIRTRRRDTFFCAAFRKYPKKRRFGWSRSCATRFCWGSVERVSCPPTDAWHPCHAPVVANPNKTCGARRGKREHNDVTE